jgi:ATP-binding protein involved in chromosome partitioning
MKLKGIFRREQSHVGPAAGNNECPVLEEGGKAGDKACRSCSSKACPGKETGLEGDEGQRSNLDRIKHRVVVLSGKGGVGKSMVAANIAVGLVKSGHAVGLLDVDMHGPSTPRLLGLAEERARMQGTNLAPIIRRDGLKVMSLGFLMHDDKEAVIWRGPVKAGLIKQFIEEVGWGDLDYLVVDCPPGTGDEPLSVLQLLGPDAGAVIVTTPQGLAIDDVRRSITFCEKVGNPVLGIVENMSGFVCPTCGDVVDIFGSGGGKSLAEEMGVPFLGGIPLDPQIARSGDRGEVFMDSGQDSPAAKALLEILKPIESMCTKSKSA